MNKQNKIAAIIVIVLFAAIVATPWVLHAALGDETAGEQEGGLVEKRDPAEWPDSLTNDVLKKIETYYEDRSPFRNNLIAFENDFSQVYETYYRKTITPILIELFMPQPKEEKPEETIEETTEEESSAEESTEEESTQEPETPGESQCEHSFDGGTVVTEADCVSNGEIVYTCQGCGEQKSEVINASHQFMLKKESLADEEHYGYKLYECERCKERELREFQEKTVATDYLVPQIDNYALYGRCDWLFFTGNSSLQDYQGSNLMSEAQLMEWKTAFETLQAACDQKGIKLVVLVLPNKEQVYREYMPTFQITSQTSRAQQIAAYMQANSSVNYVYPLEDMLETKIYYDVYLKQDTHWNDVGSFVGAMALCRALGMPTTDILDVPVTPAGYYGGDLSNMCGFASEYTTSYVQYKPDIQFTQAAVLHGGEVLHGYSSAQTDRDIVVVGDSFRVGLHNHLYRDFANVTHTHRNYMYESVVLEALSALGEGDVLVLEAVERYDYQNVTAATGLAALLK